MNKIALVIIIELMCSLCKASESDSTTILFQNISFQELSSISNKTGKPIFIDFYAEWCGPCKWMERNVFNNSEVGAFMNEHYLSLRIDAEKQELQLVKKYEIKAYPTFIIVNSSGNLVLKKEGALDANTFINMARDHINIATFKEEYQKNNDRPEVVADYVRALSWRNPKGARRIAVNFIKSTPDKKWSKAEYWSIIKEYIPGTNLVIMDKVLKNEDIKTLYPEEYKLFIKSKVKDVLQKSLQLKSQYHLSRYLGYVERNSELFDNSDSLSLTARIQYAQTTNASDLTTLLEEYVTRYESGNHAALVERANYLTTNYFNKDILNKAIQWCTDALEIKHSAEAYMTLSLAYEKLNEFQKAYAYILLADGISNPEYNELVDKHLERIREKNEYDLNEGVNTSRKTENLDDGRFTLGAGNKRLMYGYPVPSSTSHFITKIDGSLATNSPRLANKGLQYLTGYLQYGGEGMTPNVTIEFEFKGVRITQDLIPVDKKFNELDSGLAQYYQVSYKFKNLDKEPKTIGLGVLFDTMIDDNDYCTIAADDKVLDSEYGFSYKSMPKELLFYRVKGDTSDMMGTAILSGHKATRPDKMVIGRWPVLHEVTWALKPKKVRYGDSAYFLKWEGRKLDRHGAIRLTTYYGLPHHKKSELRLLVEDKNNLSFTENIFFNTGSSKLDLNAKMKISKLLERDDITISGVLLNGYADVMGGESFNFDLSKRRIDNVGKIFKAYGMPYMPKPYGNDRSTYGTYNETYGNVWDRRVEIVIYYKTVESNFLTVNP